MRTRLTFTERKLLISALRNEDEKMSENAGRRLAGILFIIACPFHFQTRRQNALDICQLRLQANRRDYFNYFRYY